MDVSVIILVYNTEQYLANCVDSILQQDNVSLEIILVDDGSTDSSPSICDKYAEEYDNITAIHIQNSVQQPLRTKGSNLHKAIISLSPTAMTRWSRRCSIRW